MDFAVSADHRINLKEGKKSDKYLDLARVQKKTVEHGSDDDTKCNWCARYSSQMISTGIGGLENKRTSGDHKNYSIVEIG